MVKNRNNPTVAVLGYYRENGGGTDGPNVPFSLLAHAS